MKKKFVKPIVTIEKFDPNDDIVTCSGEIIPPDPHPGPHNPPMPPSPPGPPGPPKPPHHP